MNKPKFSDEPNMQHFQIRFVDKAGGSSFVYFSAMPKCIVQMADLKANEWLQEKLAGRTVSRFFGWAFVPLKLVHCVEYDRQKHCALRNGLKFKIRLQRVKTTYSVSGLPGTSISINLYYEADKLESKQ